MTEQEITGLARAFANYLGRYRGCFLQKRTAAHFDIYCRGLLFDNCGARMPGTQPTVRGYISSSKEGARSKTY